MFHSPDTRSRKEFQSLTEIKERKRMSKSEAAKIIQGAFRNYTRKKLVKKLNKHVVMTFRPEDLHARPRKSKVLELFNIQKNYFLTSQDHSHELSKTARSSFEQNLSKNRSFFQKDQETVLVLGGVDPYNDYGVGRNTGKDIYRYSADDNAWEFVGELPEPRYHHSAQFLKGRVFLVGGTNPQEDEIKGKCIILSNMWSFDPITKNWFSEPCLLQARKNFGLVSSNESLYAIGGQGQDFESLQTTEKFNMEERLWEARTSMIYSRISPACSILKNYIWVAGGLSGTENNRNLLDSVESYNLKYDQWTEIRKSLQFPRCFSCLFSMGERLYLIGGAAKSSDQDDKKTVSIGDLDMWDPKNLKWKSVTKMHIPRHGHSVAGLGTQILVVGGVTTAYQKVLNNVECFCSQRGIWVRGLAHLPTGLIGHASVTLPSTSLPTG